MKINLYDCNNSYEENEYFGDDKYQELKLLDKKRLIPRYDDNNLDFVILNPYLKYLKQKCQAKYKTFIKSYNIMKSPDIKFEYLGCGIDVPKIFSTLTQILYKNPINLLRNDITTIGSANFSKPLKFLSQYKNNIPMDTIIDDIVDGNSWDDIITNKFIS